MNEKFESILHAVVMLGCFALLGFLVYVRAEGASIAAIGICTTVVGWLMKSPAKKDPPAGCALVAGAILSAALVVACGGPDAGERRAAESAYEAELLRCVDSAKTIGESRGCRAAVNARWGVDGGAR